MTKEKLSPMKSPASISKTELWTIMVPTHWNTGAKISKSTHQLWDESVMKITGGLTLDRPKKGKWKGAAEGMIPVIIAVDPSHLDEIYALTSIHYNQKAIMGYRVSDLAMIQTFEE